MKKMISDFKSFAVKGNMIDLAVGVIIGGAFGKIVSSLVNDMIMPPIGLLLGGVNFTELKITLKKPLLDAAGTITQPAVTLNYGNFLQVLMDFLIIAIAVFWMVRLVSKIQQATVKKTPPEPAPEPQPTKEEVLLTEIRDILKQK